LANQTAIPDSFKRIVRQGFDKNAEFLKQLSAETNTPICTLANEDFPPTSFLQGDFMHLNARGEAQLAKLIQKSLMTM
jgi:hypothetical protein